MLDSRAVRLDRALLFRLATAESLERAVRTVPGGEELAWRAAARYLAGRSREEALATVAALRRQGHGVSVDLFGERVEDPAQAEQVTEEYLNLIEALSAGAEVWLSVDLTHLALTADPAGAAERLTALATAAPPGCRVQVGAEDAVHADAVLDCVLTVAAQGHADRLGATLQANLHRAAGDLERLADAGVHIRLVKGAYVELAGAHPFGEPTDIAFLRLAHRLAERYAAWSMATHDGRLREALLLALGATPVEQLLGVRPDGLEELSARGVPTRVYVPYGPDWFRYWMRRVAESRGA